MTAFPSVDKADGYIKAVISGEIKACKWIKLACKRHRKDIRESKKKTYPYKYDKQAAERVCKFIQMLPHTKGKWARNTELLVLEPWQCFFICSVFGWKRKSDNMRRFRRAELFVPRKNGKSALAAAIGLYMLAADHEAGAEVLVGATSEKQALEVFKPASIMAKRTPEFTDFYGVEVFASNISIAENGSKLEPIIGDPGDGASPSLGVVDEYHEHKTDALLDTLETGMGARERPLILMITTAGSNLAGPCYQMQLDAQKMLERSIDDEITFALIYTVDPRDKWDKLETVIKANPNYGVSVDADFLNNRLNDAKNNARKQSTYKTKHLNIWVGSREAYFNVEKWRDCYAEGLELSDYEGQLCYMGLDLASKVDIAALEILIPVSDDEFVRFGKYYLPEAAIENGVNEHYNGWMKDGWLTITDGEIIDFNVIKEDILELSSLFQIEEVAYDPHQATMLVTELMDQGVPVVEMRPTVLNFSEPMKQMDGLIRAGKYQHNGDPIFTWMISNTTGKLDRKDNVYPNKERPENKIDGVVAHLMALGRSMNNNGPNLGAAIDNIISAKL